ncbi:hypothetical protein [Rhizobium leguminosarum]|uniref:hypothetical protein n=1 Tax=Rhizobium leguminosarum TaxID=384 RepID=UPI001C90A6FD|nr:hypothetical protein [Rhizobium leguminosarum]MBY2911391.1 hypothetical protein [Rhizobium leguminosarum]
MADTLLTTCWQELINKDDRTSEEYHGMALITRGFADGLNWALRHLERINSAAGDDLLKFYREENKKERGHVG